MNLYLPTLYLPTFVAVWRRSCWDSSVLSGETVHELPAATQKFFLGGGGHLGHPESKPYLVTPKVSLI